MTEGDWRYTVDPSGATVTGYCGRDEGTDTVIPSEFGGLPVVAIGKGVFFDFGFSTVTVPDSVISIGDRAFEGCSFEGSRSRTV